MKNFKKIVSTTAAFAVLAGGVSPIFAATPFSDVADTAAYKDAVVKLAGFGIMEGSNGTFRPDDNITRAEVTKVLEVALGYGKIKSSAANQFSDVDSSKWYAGAVNYAANIGLVKGAVVNKKKCFMPEANVTYGQFATMALRALGYKDTDLEGTWPYNYVAKASELGLFDNIDEVDASAFAKRSDVALMANNMLNTNKKSETADAAGHVKTLLEKVASKLGVTAISSGLVTATADTDNTLAANHVKINGTDYEAAVSNKEDLALGNKVDVYVKAGKIVQATKVAGDSITVTVSAVNAAAKTISYVDANSVTQTLTLDPNFLIYKNGQTATLANLEVGATVTLVNNDTDTDYDYINAAYTSPAYVVTNASITSDDAKTVGAVTYDGGTISLVKADATGSAVTVAGAASKLSEIKQNDVVYVTKTEDNAVIKLFVVRATVTGKVTAKTVDPANTSVTKTVTIDGTSYNVKAGLNINVNDNNMFLLDKDNTIVAVKDAPAATVANATYGVVTASVTTQATLDTAAGFKTRIMKLDGTSVDVATATLVPVGTNLVYYTIGTDGLAVISNANYGSFNSYNVVGDTLVYAIKTDAAGKVTVETVKYSDLNTTGVQAFNVAKANNAMGDYAMLAFVNPQLKSSDTTGYGYIAGKIGQTIVNDSTVADVYNVFVNGVQQTINVAAGTTFATPYFTKLSTVNNVTTVTAADNADVVTGKVNAIDATRIMVGSTIYNLDTNVKVYNTANSTVKADTLANVTTDMTNNATIVKDATTGNVVVVVINK